MTRRGRPLRFLGATLGGWVMLRVGLLWPTLEASPEVVRAFAPPTAAMISVPPASPPSIVSPALVRLPTKAIAVGVDAAALPTSAGPRLPEAEITPVAAADAADVAELSAGIIPPPLRPTPVDPARRLTGSVWGIVREGTAAGLPGGQLGGSQAGVRVAYALDAKQRVALTARLSAPLQGRGSEAAVGIELRPLGLPLRVIAEQRFALDGGRGGQAVYAVGGVGPTPVAAEFRLEGYAQAGVVVRGGAQEFVDGAARLTRPVAGTVDLGVGLWGGAQPGVTRLDVGPTIGVALPVAGQRVRLSLDWRQRVAGDARPGSGPALSIGTDF